MNYNEIKRILCNIVIGAVLCNYCIYSQDCDDGYTYYSDLPDNVTNPTNCFYNDDIAVMNVSKNFIYLTFVI